MVCLERVAANGIHRARERTGEHHIARVQLLAMGRDLVGEPRHADGGWPSTPAARPVSSTTPFLLRIAPAQRKSISLTARDRDQR